MPRVAGAIPFLVMPKGNFINAGEEANLRAELVFGLPNGVGTEARMGLHDLHFFDAETTRFVKYAVGDADFADIVQRGGLEQNIDLVVGQIEGETWVILQLSGQNADVMLRSPDMVAGFIVARSPPGQRS